MLVWSILYTVEEALRATAPAGLDHKESEVWAGLEPQALPRHIAIIMDGNGRWARRRHLPRVAGHRAGVASVRSTVETAARIGDRKSTRLNSSHIQKSRMPSSA